MGRNYSKVKIKITWHLSLQIIQTAGCFLDCTLSYKSPQKNLGSKVNHRLKFELAKIMLKLVQKSLA